MGAGMVHPKVLEGVGYDPHIYTGFAFCMGPERISMIKHGHRRHPALLLQRPPLPAPV